MTIVRETYVAPGGAPARVRHVSVVLAGEDGKPITGYVHAAGQTIVTSRRFALSPSGLISIDLVPNSLIEPSGTVWKRTVTFEDGSRDVAYWIVPDVPGPVDAADIMADPPGAIDPPGLNLLVLQIASVDAKADAAHQELDDLHPVSRSGEYSDLENTPSLAPVATSGAYADLTGLPTLGSAAAADVSDFASAAQGAKADTAVQPADLSAALAGKQDKDATLDELSGATLTAWAKSWLAIANAGAARSTLGLAPVASSGAYADLTGRPDIAGIAEGVVDGGAADREALRRGIMRDAVAWWRAADYDGTGVLADGSGRGHDMTLGAGSAAPTFLPYDGEPYVYFPAVAGNRIISDNISAWIGATVQVAVEVDMALDSWTSGSQTFASQWSSGQQSWALQITPSGALALFHSPDGTTVPAAQTTAPLGLSGRQRLKVEFLLNDGAGGRWLKVSRWTGSAWAQIGATVTGSAVAVHAPTAPLNISGIGLGVTQNIGGKVYSLTVSGNGTEVVSWRASDMGQTGGNSGGRTWTISRPTSGKKVAVVDRSLFLFGGSYMQTPDAPDLAFGAADSFTLITAYRRHGTPDGNDMLMVKRAASSATDPQYGLWLGPTTVEARLSDNVSPFVHTSIAISPAGVATSAAEIVDRAAQRLYAFSVDARNTGASIASEGSPANTGVLRIGADSVGSGSSHTFDGEWLGAAVFPRALSDEEIAAVAAVLGVDPGSTLLGRAPNALATLLRAQPALGALTTGPAMIEGTGSPQGVVAAPVGTLYRDLAATNGAVTWVKASGTGNTGWRVVWGDTGWRAITTWDAAGVVTGQALNSGSWAPMSGAGGGIFVRRTVDLVTVQVNFLERTGVTDVNVWSSYALPAGFRPTYSVLVPVVIGSSSVSSLVVANNGTLQRGASSSAGADGAIRQQSINFPAASSTPWPTSLPGTAA